ncbi:MAG: glycosyltransferase family 39 protein [Planctomycetes bacterium]|nr:glycosyltransferase family 39 protein [Planctomycetota bacterium]
MTIREQPDAAIRFQRLRILLVIVFIAAGVVTICIVPPFEGWDEYQHGAYVQWVWQTGRIPILGDAMIDPALLEKLREFPHPRGARQQLESLRLESYAEYWSHDHRSASEPHPPYARALYEAQQAPLYYYLAAPVFAAAGGVSDLRASVAALRFANILLGAAALWIVIGGLGRLFENRRDAVLVGFLVSLQPLFLIDVARVSNDALALLFMTGAITVLVAADSDRLLRSAVWAGLLAAVAIWTKAIAIALVPFSVAALLVSSGVPMARRLSAVAVALGITAALTLPYFLFNQHVYGEWTATQEAILNRGAGETGRLAQAALELPWIPNVIRIWTCLWAGGWSMLGTSIDLQRTYWITLALSLGIAAGAFTIGKGARLVAPFRVRATPARAALLVGAFFLALGWHMLHSWVAWGTVSTNPWYAIGAIPWLLVVAYAGAAALPTMWPRVAFAGVLAAVYALTTARGWVIDMIPEYAAAPFGRTALARLASLQPAWLGEPTAIVAAIVWFAALALATYWVIALARQRHGEATSQEARDDDSR